MKNQEDQEHDREQSPEDIHDILDRKIKKRTRKIEKALFQLAEQLQNDSKSKKEKEKKKDKPITWNREGHKIQNEFLVETLEALSDVEEDIDAGVDRDSCIEKIQKLKNAVKYRRKLIRIADQEEGGWETVKAYERSSLADDEEDDRKIKNAVATAKRKLREKSDSAAKKRRPNWQRSAAAGSRPYESASGQANPTTPPSQGIPAPHFTTTPRAPAPFRRGGTGGQQRPGPRDLCFRCGAPGHWSNECPSRQQGH